MMAKTGAIGLRVEQEVKDLAERAAADDSRTLASLVEKLLRDYLIAHGYMTGGKAIPADKPRKAAK